MKIEDYTVLEIFKNVSFTKHELSIIKDRFEKITLKKGEILLDSKNTCKNQYFVYSGCLRSFFVNDDGKDFTTQFAIKDWWISDYISFFKNEKTVMSIECLQDAVVYRLSKEDFEFLCLNVPKIETYIRNKLQNAFASFQKRILEYLSLSAKDRYYNFINGYPEINSYIKNYHVASYLGITTESLSRIRKMNIKS